MNAKKIIRALLFPHISLLIILLPLSAFMLVYSMVFVGTETPIAYTSYVLSAYTLTVYCFKIPSAIKFFKRFKQQNKFVKRYSGDVRMRVNISLYGSLAWNSIYALFQLCLGFRHSSFWFFSAAAYYVFLALMRFLLLRHSGRYNPGERRKEELERYRTCGWVFLFLNIALSAMIFFSVSFGKGSEHHKITTIAMAAYTFTTFTFAIINTVRYKKYRSPVFSASKAISLAAASVSMLNLTSTMLKTFGESEDPTFRKLMLSLLGGAISVFTVSTAIYMIVKGNKDLKELSRKEQDEYKRI